MQTVYVSDHDSTLRKNIEEIFNSVHLLTMATISDQGLPHVNTCYFAYDNTLKILILTPPTTRHSKFAISTGKCAVNIADTNHKIGDPIAGLQLNCDFRVLDGEDSERAYRLYCERHKKFGEFVPDHKTLLESLESRFCEMRITTGQIIHETRLGSENYVQFGVLR